MNYFKAAEFTKESVMPTYAVEGLINWQLPVLNLVRSRLGYPIYISERSGYRSIANEKRKGRSGNSMHTYQDGKGAVDLTCNPEHLDRLGRMLAEHSPYTRICFYPAEGFYHCDYKSAGHRFYHSIDGNWKRVTKL